MFICNIVNDVFAPCIMSDIGTEDNLVYTSTKAKELLVSCKGNKPLCFLYLEKYPSCHLVFV